jgi:alkylation response protein AidB-like acyl-CoA dehydrogenase
MWRLTDEQRALREEIRAVVREEIRPRVRKIDEDCEYPRDLYAVMAEHQLLGLSFPPEYGGRCTSEVSWCAYVEELAKVSGTVSLMAAYVKLASLPLLLAGSEEQRQEYVPRLIRGEILGSFALSEPNVGSDPAGLETRAERRGDVWVLNGEKKFIGNAGLSDVYVVFARTGDKGPRGVSCFLVDGHAPGVSSTKLRTMGMPGWQLGAPRFEDVEVPAENLIGREGQGFKIAMATFDHSRPTVAAQSVGVAQGAVDLAVDYALRRHAFGQPLLGHQGIQFKLAELEAEIAAARALTFQAASAVDDEDPRLTKLASMAKLKASDAAMHATTEAVQVLGGNGYLKDYPAERMMRDAKVLQIYEGANEIQRLVIARQMALEGERREPMWPEMMPAGREPAKEEAVGTLA